MNKYWIIFVTQVKNLLAYRANVLLKLVRPVVMTAIIVSLWYVIFEITGSETIAGLTFGSYVLYFLIIRFVAVFSPGSAVIRDINDQIITGNIAMRLVRPMNYLLWLFARNLPVSLFSGVLGLVCVYVLSIAFGGTFPTGLWLLLFVVSCCATILLQYATYQGIGILSFWIYEIWSIERLFVTLRAILAGEMIPLTLFSPFWRSILELLPFAGFAFVPAGVYLQLFSFEHALLLVGVQYIWVIIAWIIMLALFSKGLKKFEAQGG